MLRALGGRRDYQGSLAGVRAAELTRAAQAEHLLAAVAATTGQPGRILRILTVWRRHKPEHSGLSGRAGSRRGYCSRRVAQNSTRSN